MADGSNSANMTLEDKLVQVIKEDKLAALIDDEDSVNDLVKRALNEALFNERTETVPNPNGWGQAKIITTPSLVVQAAREVTDEAVNEVAKAMLDEIMRNEEIVAILREVLPKLLLQAILGQVQNSVAQLSEIDSNELLDKMNTAFANQHITIPRHVVSESDH